MEYITDFLPELRHELGAPARLIPTSAQDELRTTNVFLATLSIVDDFAKALLGNIGLKMKPKSRMTCFTEVKLNCGDRIDGAIFFKDTKGEEVRILVEAKTGSNSLKKSDNAKQVARYLDQCKNYGFTHILTISNDFASSPDLHPVNLDGRKSSGKAFHWSWSSILSEAHIQLKHLGVADPEQAFILKEFIAYMEDPKTGVYSFNKMHKDWKKVSQALFQKHTYRKNAPEITEMIGNLHEYSRYLSISLNTAIAVNVTEEIKKEFKGKGKEKWLYDCETLSSEFKYNTSYAIPNTVSNLNMEFDFAAHAIRLGVQFKVDDSVASKTNTKLKRLIDSFQQDNKESSLKDYSLVVNFKGKGNLTKPIALTSLFTKHYMDEFEGYDISKGIAWVKIEKTIKLSGREKDSVDCTKAAHLFYADILQNLYFGKNKKKMPAPYTMVENTLSQHSKLAA